MRILDKRSVSSVPIQVLSETGENIACATGFFYNYNGDIYLVSNWHVLSGRNPLTGKTLHLNRAIPSSISFPLMKKNKIAEWETYNLSLLDEHNECIWLHHNAFGQGVDIAVIKIDSIPSGLKANPINLNDDVKDLDISAGIDVFILGYPLNQTKQKNIPVWKKGSIASEPHYPLDDHNECFLIDCATREGMSGAPVIARQFGFYLREDGEVPLLTGIHSRFLGVYSGRYLGNSLMEMQLGIVWKEEYLIDIILVGVKGNFKLIKQ